MDTCEETNQEDITRINRVKISLSKIELGIIGLPLAPSVLECKTKEPEKFEKLYEPHIYWPNDAHALAVVPTIMDELSFVTKEIDLIVCDRARDLERDRYFKLKLLFCDHIDAIALDFARKVNYRK